MRVLILHQVRFYKAKYERAIDHEKVDVCYAGTREYLDQIPHGLRHTTFTLEGKKPALPQLRSWLRHEPRFDRILTRQESLLMDAAHLRAEFDITGMRPEETIVFRDKVRMKKAVASKGLHVPCHVRIDRDLGELPWAGKTILKPVDGAGSRDVRLFQSSAEALLHVRRALAEDAEHSHVECFELEEFIAGPIWHVDGYLHQGEPAVIKTSRYVGTCLGYAFGRPLGSVQHDNPELAHWALRCLAALGARDLTFHLEAILSKDGPVFLEVAGRAGGAEVVETIERSTGVNLHVLDMSSDVAGHLPERVLPNRVNSMKYGWFLLPGHQLKGAPCRVLGADEFLASPLVETLHRLAETSPTPMKSTYQSLDVPLAGIVAGHSSAELERWMRGLFRVTRVVASTGT